MKNPVTSKKHYRLYVLNNIPSLRVLDFQRIKMKAAIANAKTLEEVGRLTNMLKTGQIPGKAPARRPGQEEEEN